MPGIQTHIKLRDKPQPRLHSTNEYFERVAYIAHKVVEHKITDLGENAVRRLAESPRPIEKVFANYLEHRQSRSR